VDWPRPSLDLISRLLWGQYDTSENTDTINTKESSFEIWKHMCMANGFLMKVERQVNGKILSFQEVILNH
jgi:hypothetical protein